MGFVGIKMVVQQQARIVEKTVAKLRQTKQLLSINMRRVSYTLCYLCWTTTLNIPRLRRWQDRALVEISSQLTSS